MNPHDDSAMDEPLPDAAEVREAYDALPGGEVPAALDTSILARARAAAEQNNTVVELKRPAVRRWAIPIATAASVVMVMSVVYEMQFSSPRETPIAGTTAIGLGADTAIQEDREVASEAPVSEDVAKKSAQARASQPSAAAITNSLQAPPVMDASGASPPRVVALTESIVVAPPAPVIHVPLPSSPATERTTVADEVREERSASKASEVESSEQRDKKAEPASAGSSASVASASTQLLGKAAGLAEARPSLTPLAQLAGHYRYESYSFISPSGHVVGMTDRGYSAATLDIDAQGTLTQRITMSKGKVVTRTAKILEAKLDNDSGYWIAQWSDMTRPTKVEISREGEQLFSTTRFTNPADGPLYGSLEQITLQRIVRK
jgi:hypothetical protein